MNGREAGLSLIEVLVALLLLGLLLTGVSQYLLSIPRVNVQSAAQQGVTLDAKAYFEGVRTTLRANFDTPASGLPATPGGCTTPSVSTVLNVVELGVTKAAVRRVSLTCAAGGRSYTFSQDYGRPL